MRSYICALPVPAISQLNYGAEVNENDVHNVILQMRQMKLCGLYKVEAASSGTGKIGDYRSFKLPIFGRQIAAPTVTYRGGAKPYRAESVRYSSVQPKYERKNLHEFLRGGFYIRLILCFSLRFIR